MITRLPVLRIAVASLFIMFVPDTLYMYGIPVYFTLRTCLVGWFVWKCYRIRKPLCHTERQQQMLEFVDAGLKLAQNEQQRALLVQWAQANARGTRQAGGD